MSAQQQQPRHRYAVGQQLVIRNPDRDEFAARIEALAPHERGIPCYLVRTASGATGTVRETDIKIAWDLE